MAVGYQETQMTMHTYCTSSLRFTSNPPMPALVFLSSQLAIELGGTSLDKPVWMLCSPSWPHLWGRRQASPAWEREGSSRGERKAHRVGGKRASQTKLRGPAAKQVLSGSQPRPVPGAS